MTLRFTNRVIKTLKDDHQIDLLSGGIEFADQEKVAAIVAAASSLPVDEAKAKIDDMTPGELAELLLTSYQRDFTPKSQLEANAKAAAANKSPEIQPQAAA